MAIPLSSEAVSEVIAIGNRTAEQYPRAWSKCHHESDPERLDFIMLFARAACYSAIINKTHLAGMNGKRGNAYDPSMDVLSFLRQWRHRSARCDSGGCRAGGWRQ